MAAPNKAPQKDLEDLILFCRSVSPYTSAVDYSTSYSPVTQGVLENAYI